jgi:hypothetical protein
MAKLVKRSTQRRWQSWSPREDHVIRTLYASAPQREVLRHLPARSWGGIIARAHLLGVRRERHFWSAEKDKLLRTLWPDTTRKTICAHLGRTWSAVLNRARKIGLRGRGATQRWSGYVSLTQAGRVIGCSHAQLWRALDAYRAHYQTLPREVRAELPPPTPISRGTGRITSARRADGTVIRQGPLRVIELQAAIDAYQWWDSLETQSTAARRMGRSRSTLSLMALRAGVRMARCDRRSPEWWDALVAHHAASVRASRELTKQHGRR